MGQGRIAGGEECKAYRTWLGRETVIFVIRFTFHVSRITIFG